MKNTKKFIDKNVKIVVKKSLQKDAEKSVKQLEHMAEKMDEMQLRALSLKLAALQAKVLIGIASISASFLISQTEQQSHGLSHRHNPASLPAF